MSDILSSATDTKILTPTEAENEDFSQYSSLALIGGTEDKPMMLNAYLRTKAEEFAKSGKPIFLEYVPSFACVYSAQPIQITSHRLVSHCDLTDEIKKGDLLDSHYNQYIRPHFLMPNTKALMYYRQYTPAHDRLDGETESNDIALFSYENVVCADKALEFLGRLYLRIFEYRKAEKL